MSPLLVAATSILCYRQIAAEGLLSRMRFRVYDALVHHGSMTGGELDQLLGTGDFHKRLRELEDLGVAEIIGQRPCKVTGRLCDEWRAKDGLPSGKVRKLGKREKRERLELEIATLQQRVRELEEELRRRGPQLSLLPGARS